MRSRAKRYFKGGLALLVGGVGVGLLVTRRVRRSPKNETSSKGRRDTARDRWARPGMTVTFRAELMPSRETSERTFHVAELLPSGRVLLDGVAGEHTESEFEPAR
jgi:hypothetical protein